MALLAAPTYDPSNLSNPIIFVMQVSNPNPLLYALAQLFVRIDGVATAADMQVTPTVAGGGLFTFEIDFKALATQELPPLSTKKSSVFGDSLNVSYTQGNTDSIAELALIVTYWEEDPTTGNPSNIGYTDTVAFGSYYALPAYSQRWGDLGLAEHFTVANRKNFTNQPQPYEIVRGENLFLTLPAISIDQIKVETFDSSGSSLAIDYYSKTNQTTWQPYTIGVGTKQLVDLGSTSVDNAASYKVSGGLNLAGTYIQFTQEQEYKIIEACYELPIRVHFYNELGGADAFTFAGKNKRLQVTKSKQAQTPLSWDYSATPPTNIFDRGLIKIDNKAGFEYEVESRIYTAAQAEWLGELFSSPETYIEHSAGLLPCIVQDASVVMDDSSEFFTAKAKIIILGKNTPRL